MGDIKDVIRGSVAAHNAPLTISFHAGDFEEGMQAVNLFLAFTLWLYRRSSYQPAFFCRLLRGRLFLVVAEDSLPDTLLSHVETGG